MNLPVEVPQVRAKVEKNRRHYAERGLPEMVDACDLMLTFVQLAEAIDACTRIEDGVLVFVPTKKRRLVRVLERFTFEERVPA